MGQKLAAKEVQRNLRALTDPFWSTKFRTYAGFSDSIYYLPSVDELDVILKDEDFVVPVPKHMKQGFDCDDFAYVFKGRSCLYARDNFTPDGSLCLGIAWADFSWVNEFHAANWALCDDLNLYWVEPQDLTRRGAAHCQGNLCLLLV